MGSGHEDGDRAARGLNSAAGDRVAYLRLSRAGDLRLSLCASGQAGFGWYFRAVVDERSLPHRLPVSAALHSASCPLEVFEGRNIALLGCEIGRAHV